MKSVLNKVSLGLIVANVLIASPIFIMVMAIYHAPIAWNMAEAGTLPSVSPIVPITASLAVSLAVASLVLSRKKA
jgi:hypothetical protein